MSDGVWGDLRNESEASDGKSRGKISGTEKGKERKGGRKKNLWKGRSEEIFCTGLVSIRKEKGDDTLPAGE